RRSSDLTCSLMAVTGGVAALFSMPISATGRQQAKAFQSMLITPQSRGFTLLELMLVLVVMAVVASFVLPNLFQPAGASLDDSARRMVRMLHLAAEEAQLRGTSLRFNAKSDRYNFELAGDDGQWQILSEALFAERMLPEGVSISEVKLAEGVQFYGGLANRDSVGPDSGGVQGASDQTDAKKAEQVTLGSVTLMSDGMLSLGEIQLHSKQADVQIELRPGPGGIRIVAPDNGK
ncbi:MAG: GspH/FimT family pseudopilin, partial [Mariprofundaceae bacterium]|nr:GspH/FimT family pseudopilin [Mariprofundaceae bacterium]